MGIIDRIKLNVRANLNYALDKAEDPEKILDQFLLDMKESIYEFKQSIVNAIAGAKKLERDISENSEKVSLWEDRALLALKKGDEELAKKALERKLYYVENGFRAKEELEKQKQTVEELKATLPALEKKLDELYQKRTELIRKSIQIKKESTRNAFAKEPTTQLGIDSSVFYTYDSVADKIKALEDQMEAIAELEKLDDTEEKFKKMEKDEKVEAELKAMKSNL